MTTSKKLCTMKVLGSRLVTFSPWIRICLKWRVLCHYNRTKFRLIRKSRMLAFRKLRTIIQRNRPLQAFSKWQKSQNAVCAGVRYSRLARHRRKKRILSNSLRQRICEKNKNLKSRRWFGRLRSWLWYFTFMGRWHSLEIPYFIRPSQISSSGQHI